MYFWPYKNALSRHAQIVHIINYSPIVIFSFVCERMGLQMTFGSAFISNVHGRHALPKHSNNQFEILFF